MKKVITTVGTSLFLNYQKNAEQCCGELHEDYIFNKPFSEWNGNYNEQTKEKIWKWLHSGNNLNGISAEIQSLNKLQEERKEELEVFLISTDTVASNLAAEIIDKFFENNENIKVKSKKRICSLQVKDRSLFTREGFPNLINEINSISDGYFENLIMNITGGFKGIIPYLTIFSSINNVEIVYIYEESSEMISIPPLPIEIDKVFIEDNVKYLAELDSGIENYPQFKNTAHNQLTILEKRGFVESIDKIAFLSPIGKIFYERFKKNHFKFFCSNDVWNAIQKQKDIKRILRSKFPDEMLRSSKSEQKQDHLVFDDGDNNNRIYYFTDDGNIYIYKTFECEENAREYIDKTIDKVKIKTESKIRTITLEGK